MSRYRCIFTQSEGTENGRCCVLSSESKLQNPLNKVSFPLFPLPLQSRFLWRCGHFTTFREDWASRVPRKHCVGSPVERFSCVKHTYTYINNMIHVPIVWFKGRHCKRSKKKASNCFFPFQLLRTCVWSASKNALNDAQCIDQMLCNWHIYAIGG